jgi:hypothetical protein
MSEQSTSPKPPVSLSDNPALKFEETTLWGDKTAVYRQRVDSVSLPILEAGFDFGNSDFPDGSAPHEVGFQLGGKVHRIWSAEPGFGRVNTTNIVLQSARDKNIPVADLRSDPGSEDPKYWVHTQHSDEGKIQGIELIDIDAYRNVLLEDGQPLHKGSSETISNLQVAHYGREEAAIPTGLPSH